MMIRTLVFLLFGLPFSLAVVGSEAIAEKNPRILLRAISCGFTNSGQALQVYAFSLKAMLAMRLCLKCEHSQEVPPLSSKQSSDYWSNRPS